MAKVKKPSSPKSRPATQADFDDPFGLGSEAVGGSEPIRAIKDVLSSSDEKGLISRYSDLSDHDIDRISFLETYAIMVKQMFNVDVNFIPIFTKKYKEHRVSANRKGREEIVKILTVERQAEQEQASLLKRLMGVK